MGAVVLKKSISRLLRLLANSEKRSRIVLMLAEKPKSLAELSKKLGSSSSNVLPQIRKLEIKGLVKSDDGTYSLTEFGKLVAELFSGFLSGIEVIKRHKKFWTEHDISGIPDHLLKRIHELEGCYIVENPPESIYEPHKEFVENIESSSFVYGISSVYHPAYPRMFLELAKSGKEVRLILTKAVFEKVGRRNGRELEKYLSLENAAMHVSEKEVKLAMVVTDKFFSISLYFKNGIYDSSRDLISFSKTALLWGRELFEYYLKTSRRIKSL
jgi:predicted transcriptional regulator